MKHYDAYLFDWDGTLAMTHDIADLTASNPTYTIHAWQEFLDRLQ